MLLQILRPLETLSADLDVDGERQVLVFVYFLSFDFSGNKHSQRQKLMCNWRHGVIGLCIMLERLLTSHR